MSAEAEVLLDANATLGEGALWHAQSQVLYWVDIMGNRVHVYDPATRKDRVIDVGQPVGTIVPRKSGGVMLALQHGFASLDLKSEKLEIVSDPESHLPGNRFNDGKCDPAGRFWAGTMSRSDTPAAGSLYRLDADLQVYKMEGNITCSNGIAWSLDRRTMYYIDTMTMTVVAYDYNDASGAIANKRVVITCTSEHGLPDGMSIDAEGMLWIAHWDGSSVRRWDPKTGKLLRSIAIPAARATSCAFGGKNLDQLYITSARIGLDADALARQPHAGALFLANPGVRGVEAFEFAG
jgi:sugar lactone lactonase YvrE